MAQLRFRWWYLRWTFRVNWTEWRDLGCSRSRALWLSLFGSAREIGVSRDVYALWKKRP